MNFSKRPVLKPIDIDTYEILEAYAEFAYIHSDTRQR